MKNIITIILLCFSITTYTQDISLQNQFSGQVDFTMFGNTLNYFENESAVSCDIQTSSSANLDLYIDDTIIAAYLYWAGSGTGDFDVKLNGVDISAIRTFSDEYVNHSFFSAYADVTTQIQNTGIGTYTLSDLDLTNVIGDYCENGINFGGWAIVVVYSNTLLSENMVNIYDGLQSVPNSVFIQLNNLDVIDNNDAKIGFLAWEGDSSLANNESLRINGNVISNPPLNPADNVFNGTNSFTGATDLYNMDLDVFSLDNNIQPGDTSLSIEITSNQDYVMLNCIAVKLNTKLPDAACQINNYTLKNCNDRTIEINFDIINTIDASSTLRANVPISIYADNIYITTFYTTEEIAINSSINMTKEISIPFDFPYNFELKLIADDNNGNGIVFEINELNNESLLPILVPQKPIVNPVEVQYACSDLSDEISSFDTSAIQQIILGGIGEQTNMEVFYFDEEGNSLSSPLPNPFVTSTQTIEVLVQNPNDVTCTATTSIDFVIVPFPSFNVSDNLICTESYPISTTIFIDNALDTYNYVWYNQAGEQIGTNQDNIEIFSSGNYSVTATSTIYPCTTTKDFFVSSERIDLTKPADLLLCDEGFSSAVFDLESIQNQISLEDNQEISYFISLDDLLADNNEIPIPSTYQNQINPQMIYVKVLDNSTLCYNYTSFSVSVEKCPPIVPQIFTPNLDTNQVFTINGLRDIFLDYDLKIYNRYGNLVYHGNNTVDDWDGNYNKKPLPTGTYFYILNLNDNYFEFLKGWVYLLR